MARGGQSKPKSKAAPERKTESYRHPEAESLLRPEVGTQAQFRKKKPPVTYRHDSSLSPALEWDGRNAAREQGEWLLAIIEKAAALPPPHKFDKPAEFRSSNGRIVASVAGLRDALDQLKRLEKPFLNWAGKAERLSFNVPTLPLFVHERLSTKAIIETLQSHKKIPTQADLFDLFGDPKHPISDQVLKAYEYRDKWVNRMILGDSLVVMNSLLHYEGLGGQVQMIYIDPPYGVRFGSNFQPFIRKRDVSHNDDEDMTREPEMVKAYRDTWELGLHSYLSYLRDRLLLARELLHSSGSIFVQISDENLHHVRELMDEIFGPENFCSLITFQKTGGAAPALLSTIGDYLLWYAKDRTQVKYRQLFSSREIGQPGTELYQNLELPDGTTRRLTHDEISRPSLIPVGAKVFQTVSLQSPGASQTDKEPLNFKGKKYWPNPNAHWKTHPEGRQQLIVKNRVIESGDESVRWKMYLSDFPVIPITNIWTDTQQGGFNDPKVYVVQTATKVVQRCLLMSTDPGDLVLDPTCGSGTTAYLSEQWGRRWITVDTSRVPLALARQRLLTATFSYYKLQDESRGPVGGFIYARKQNQRGEEIGGIVPHITLGSIANSEPANEEILGDRPEIDEKVIRVTGPFCVEATVPTPIDWDHDGLDDTSTDLNAQNSYLDRMLEVLRRSPVLQIGGGKGITLRNVRQPAKSLSLSAEAVAGNGADKSVALVFGPENGAISEKLVFEAAREAHAKSYAHLYVIGFAIQPNARRLVEDSEAATGIPATYVQATPDLMMGDLLKTMRSSQIFSVCGMPEVRLCKVKVGKVGEPMRYQVELLGLDVFDPVTMNIDHRKGDDVPAWLLDTDYNGLVFHGSQVFFPRTAAWDNLKKALKATHEETVWDHLAGTSSAPFEAGEHGQIAVKVSIRFQ